jgi:ABC-type bacteriocin/lantibiotic exporter with double-glycine peptidase domain
MTGCASLATERGEGTAGAVSGALIDDVPFFPQEKHLCGPASLAAVLSYYGLPLNQRDIADEVYLPDLKGTLPVDMLLYAKGRGFNATYYSGGMDDLKEQLSLGRPVILFLNLGYGFAPRGHYIVAVGYDDSAAQVIAHSGRKRARPFSYKKLERLWGRTNFATLLILPPEVPPKFPEER